MSINRNSKKEEMKETANIQIERLAVRQIRVSFKDQEALLSFKFDFIREYLKDLITKRDTTMEIDLNGIHSIDNEIIDTLNFLCRLGKKFNSKLVLKNVEPKVFEMIGLARKYYVFDVKQVELVTSEV